MGNQALLTILQEFYNKYDLRHQEYRVHLHNTWFGANRFAEGNHNANIHDLATLLHWLKTAYPNDYSGYLDRILGTLSPNDQIKLKDSLYGMKLHDLNLENFKTLAELQNIPDTDCVGAGKGIVMDIIARLYLSASEARETNLAPEIAREFTDTIPQVLDLVANGFRKVNPDDENEFYIQWINPFHPKVPFLPGYLENRKQNVLSNVKSTLQIPQIAYEVFARCIAETEENDPKQTIWRDIVSSVFYSPGERDKYLQIATQRAKAEHEFMDKSFNLDRSDRTQWLKEYLTLARNIYNDNHGADAHLDVVITLLQSTMNEGYTYRFGSKSAADLDPQEIKLKLMLAPEKQTEFEEFINSASAAKPDQRNRHGM